MKKIIILSIACCGFAAAWLPASASPGPRPAALPAGYPLPKDIAFPGTIELAIDARDTQKRIVHVHEVVPQVVAGTTFAYPKWLPGTHAPQGPIDRLAGLTFSINGKSIPWQRDPLDAYRFHLPLPVGTSTVTIDFDYLSPTSERVGERELSPDAGMLEWNDLVLYPVGYYTRQIAVSASVRLPQGWQAGSALEPIEGGKDEIRYRTVPLETLVDSPIYAGRYARRIDLDPDGAAPVHLDIFADRADELAATEAQLAPHRALIQQAYKLYGSHHYDHYDFLLSISDEIHGQGLEHHRSSEDGVGLGYFTEWDKNVEARDLLPHEYTHSWNGKFRRPADLWTPDYQAPMQDSLLWVYEGQTQYWGQVLTARSGLWTAAEARDALALTAAYYDRQAGREWRALQDTTNDEIINPRRPMAWSDWQRFEDYYSEGQLIWLDADTLIRERSGGKRSLDDFAKAFFGIDNGSFVPVTYTFSDVVATLNKVEAYDWASFLRARVDGTRQRAPLDGITRGGYRLVYTAEPNAFQKAADESRKQASFAGSIGVVVSDKDGALNSVVWQSPAFKAGLTEGMEIVAVNGRGYSAERLTSGITDAAKSKQPLSLIVRSGDRYQVVEIAYFDGLRYPHLERDSAQPARLDDILMARP